MTRLAKLSGSSALALFLFGAALPARAQSQFDANHPRRAEVNDRLQNQNARIRQGEKNGTVDKQQAHQLHQEHQQIRGQERADAAAQGGHITKREQGHLNREEDRESRQIYREKH